MKTTGSVWKALLASAGGVFTSPSQALFNELVSAWVIAPGRPTITGMVAVMDPVGRAAHDAYHRFVRAGAWSMEALWAAMVAVVVSRLGAGPIQLIIDDTLLHREGRKVQGAGVWRDAVRSSGQTVVFARGAQSGRAGGAFHASLGRHAPGPTSGGGAAPKGRTDP